MDKLVYRKSENIGIRGKLKRIDADLVYFEGEKGDIIVQKSDVVYITSDGNLNIGGKEDGRRN